MTLVQYFKYIIAKFSHFSVKRAELQLNRSGAQTKTAREKRQKAANVQWNANL